MKAPNKFFRFSLSLLLLLMVSCQTAVKSEDIASPQSRFSENQHVEYIIGNLPVVISAPHGGRLAPESIPDRTRGTFSTDVDTDLLAREILEAFRKQTGKNPHMIICHVKRIKVDCNRNLEEAALGDPGAEKVWHDFHGFIEEAIASVINTSGEGFYVDLHGHSHPEALLELGYLISNRQLQQSDEALNALASSSSIRGLLPRTEATFLELLRGESSFGALMQRRGIPSAPSPAYPHVGEAKFFGGGPNTRRYCTRDDGKIYGFQMECPRKGVRDSVTNRLAFADAFAEAVVEYLRLHTNLVW